MGAAHRGLAGPPRGAPQQGLLFILWDTVPLLISLLTSVVLSIEVQAR